MKDLKKIEYTFQEVCEHYKIPYTSLVERISPLYLDCMGTKINALKFCKEKHTLSPLLTRGVVTADKIICEKSTFVNLGVVCDGPHKSICGQAKGSCEELKASFAQNLYLENWALEGRYLNCQYQAKNNSSKKIH